MIRREEAVRDKLKEEGNVEEGGINEGGGNWRKMEIEIKKKKRRRGRRVNSADGERNTKRS